MLQVGGKPQRGQQRLSGSPQQAGILARGARWGHLGAREGDPLQVVKEGGVLLMAMEERPAIRCSQSAK